MEQSGNNIHSYLGNYIKSQDAQHAEDDCNNQFWIPLSTKEELNTKMAWFDFYVSCQKKHKWNYQQP